MGTRYVRAFAVAEENQPNPRFTGQRFARGRISFELPDYSDFPEFARASFLEKQHSILNDRLVNLNTSEHN